MPWPADAQSLVSHREGVDLTRVCNAEHLRRLFADDDDDSGAEVSLLGHVFLRAILETSDHLELKGLTHQQLQLVVGSVDIDRDQWGRKWAEVVVSKS